MMSNDYVHVFKQFTLYKQYLRGGPTSHGLDKNELLLRRAQGSNDLAKLAIVVANYTSRSSFTNRLPHLERKEVFGFAKRPIDCFLGIDEDSHHLDHLNFSHPWVSIMVVEHDILEDTHIQQLPSSISDLLPFLS
jgi:hypothetical protein